jgi:regulator of nucleoside diphosphate kinase
MNDIRRDLSPAIILGQSDHSKLNELAIAGLDRLPELADRLLGELERARVVDDKKVPEGVARMGSRITYRTNDDKEISVTLVYPAAANIDEGKISVMTPIGTALIGLRKGQSITWRDRAEKRHMLTVLDVEVPVAAE